MISIKTLAKQVRKPVGFLGTLMGKAMNVGHSPFHNWMLNRIDLTEYNQILDIGCGGGGVVKKIAMRLKAGKVYGIDYSEDMVKLASKVNAKLIKLNKVSIEKGTVSELPFPDEYFDLITAFESFYFWPDHENDLREVHRVLKPGGKLLIGNEMYSNPEALKYNEKMSKKLNLKIHSEDEFRDLLIKTGYSEIRVLQLPKKNWISVLAER